MNLKKIINQVRKKTGNFPTSGAVENNQQITRIIISKVLAVVESTCVFNTMANSIENVVERIKIWSASEQETSTGKMKKDRYVQLQDPRRRRCWEEATNPRVGTAGWEPEGGNKRVQQWDVWWLIPPARKLSNWTINSFKWDFFSLFHFNFNWVILMGLRWLD